MPDEAKGGCGCFLLVLIINLTLGGFCTQYILQAWLQRDVAWYFDVLIGLFGGEFTIPAAIITWLLKASGAV